MVACCIIADFYHVIFTRLTYSRQPVYIIHRCGEHRIYNIFNLFGFDQWYDDSLNKNNQAKKHDI